MAHARETAPKYSRFGAISLTLMLLIALAACSSQPDVDVEATVVQFLDDGSVQVQLQDGGRQTVVLAGIETSPRGAEGAESCLSEETIAFVRRAAPPGASLQIRRVAGETPSGSTVAGTVLLNDGGSLNQALVREGLAIPVTSSAEAVSPELQVAQDEARSAQVGLYSDEIPCTVPGHVAQFSAGVNCAATQVKVVASTTASLSSSSTSAMTSPGPMPTTSTGFTATVAASGSAQIASQVERAALLVQQATELQRAVSLDASTIFWRALNEAQRTSCIQIINDAVAFATSDHANLAAALDAAQQQEAEVARVAEEQRVAAEAARVAEEQRLAAEAEAARVAEEQRLAAEAEAARVAAEQQAADAEAARVAAEQEAEAQRRAAAAAEAARVADAQRPPSADSSGGSSGSSGGPSTYTGPRCYAPGGKTWKPC